MKDLQKIQKRISSITDTVKRAEAQKLLDEATLYFNTHKNTRKLYQNKEYESATYSQYLLKDELENMMKNQGYRNPEIYIDETVFLSPVYKFLKKHPGIDLSDSTQLSKLSIKEQRELSNILISAKAESLLKEFDALCGGKLHQNIENIIEIMGKNINPDIPVKPQSTINSFNNDLDNLIIDMKAKKDITDVSATIKEIIENDGLKISDENIAKLNDVANNPKFDNLSDEDKKLVIMATLLQDSKNIASQTDTVFDVYNVASKLGMTRQSADRLLNITKAGSFITDFMNSNKTERLVTTVTRGDNILTRERTDLFTECAWDLKDNNDFVLAQIIYQAGEPQGLTRNIDKMLENKIQRIRENQILLPQSSREDILAHTQIMTINGIDVPVAKASDIPGFRTFTHSAGGTTNHQSTSSALKNLENFDMFGNTHNVCMCYVGGDNLTYYGLDGYALMMDVDPNKLLIGSTKDLNSVAKTKSQSLSEFYTDYNNRQYDLESMSVQISKALDISKSEYAKRIANLKQNCGSDFSINNMRKYDAELAEVLENGMLEAENRQYNSSSNEAKYGFYEYNSYNEFNAYQPTIKGIIVKDPSRLRNEILVYAKEHNLPIVILNNKTLDYVESTIANLNRDNLKSVDIQYLKEKINQLRMPLCIKYENLLKDKLDNISE